jgi:4'-phosphopantetheinyl transferase
MPDLRSDKLLGVRSLERDTVDVWHADLAMQNDCVVHLLMADERVRASQFVRAQDQYRWTCARGILRILLAHYVGMEPQAIRILIGPYGKPALADGPKGLRFNLSHAGDTCVYAFALGSAVGIDVELPRPQVDIVAVALRVFGSDVASRLNRLEGPARERAFLRAWVRHEAALKCRGIGIGAAEIPSATGPFLSITEFDVGTNGAIAALALEGKPRQVRQWVWQGIHGLKI